MKTGSISRARSHILFRLIATLAALTGIFLDIPENSFGGVTPASSGYALVASDGGIFSFGDAGFFGSTGGTRLAQPIVGMAPRITGNGYWLVAADGGIFSFGDARFFGSTGGMRLARPVVGMAATPSGNGYWLVASDGGIFSFGDAKFYGSTGGIHLAQPIVGMATSPTGNGYWLVAADGGIFAFGDAKFFGSTGGTRLAKPIVGMTSTPGGKGYWLVASDGGIFAYGDAKFYGSMGGKRLNQPVVGMTATPSGAGYWLVASDGGIFSFGDARFFGSTGGMRLNRPIVGIATFASDAPSVAASTATVLAAGDIADCGSTGDESTAALLDQLPGTVLALGDVVYPDGSSSDFANCYNPTWGRHFGRTKPSVGNHEYSTSNASGYFGYFGAAAGPVGKGYYSYNLGAWHLIALNGNCSYVGGCQAGSAQESWLRADLAAHPNLCTLAYWHQPRFSSGNHGDDSTYQPLWEALYDYNADVVLNGHDHDYERFARQGPTGRPDARGAREFVVGTGGASHTGFSTTRSNSEVRNSDTFGVLSIDLQPNGYSWKFLPAAGKTFSDSGSDTCH